MTPKRRRRKRPLSTTGVNQCVYAQFSSGEVGLGGLHYPIAKTITFQGGLIVVESPPSETFVGAADGNTLSKTAEVVPVRAHLKNIHLGEACYIGSSARPITLNLTTGTTAPAGTEQTDPKRCAKVNR